MQAEQTALPAPAGKGDMIRDDIHFDHVWVRLEEFTISLKPFTQEMLIYEKRVHADIKLWHSWPVILYDGDLYPDPTRMTELVDTPTPPPDAG